MTGQIMILQGVMPGAGGIYCDSGVDCYSVLGLSNGSCYCHR